MNKRIHANGRHSFVNPNLLVVLAIFSLAFWLTLPCRNSVDCSGKFVPAQELDATGEVSTSPSAVATSPITKMLAMENAEVRKGDVLIIQDSSEFEFLAKQEEINIAKLDAVIRGEKLAIENDKKLFETKSISMTIQLESAKNVYKNDSQRRLESTAAEKAKLALRKKELARALRLWKKSAMSTAELDTAQFNYGVADSELRKRQVPVENGEVKRLATELENLAAEFQRDCSEHATNIDIAQKELESAKAKLAFAKLQIAKCIVESPCDGVVIKQTCRAGDYMVAGQEIGIEIASTQDIVFEALLDARDAVDVEVSNTATVSISGLDPLESKIPARVISISPKSEIVELDGKQKHVYTVKLQLDLAGHPQRDKVRLGLIGSANIQPNGSSKRVFEKLIESSPFRPSRN